MSAQGVVTIASNHSVQETLDRAEALVKTAGAVVFGRIDHQAGAARAGLTMPPTQLLIFGSPRSGTPLMLADPTFGIELPLKLLAWQDADGHVWVSHHSLISVGAQHGGVCTCELEQLETGLHAVARKAAH